MTTAFDRHGIRHLSASALNLWKSDPALYAGKYLLRWSEDAGPNAWLGSAVEAGLTAWLYKRDIATAKEAADREWLNRSQGDVSDDVEAVKARILPMLGMAIDATRGVNDTPTSSQARVECWLDDIPVPVIGFTDLEWPDSIVDLKTTKAMPSSPRPDHVAQMAVYWLARGREKSCSLLYVTDKKHAVYRLEPEDMERALDDLRSTARTLERFLSRVRDGHDAIALLPADTTGYRWSDNLRERLNAERMAA
ncbi:MAG: PD-(D/E)XK nuclease family protein [Gemmatimonadetes bacterium]|nr:PD-(D/E)XK nuclease family protein [Gemmatimonadota bacterium]